MLTAMATYSEEWLGLNLSFESISLVGLRKADVPNLREGSVIPVGSAGHERIGSVPRAH